MKNLFFMSLAMFSLITVNLKAQIVPVDNPDFFELSIRNVEVEEIDADVESISDEVDDIDVGKVVKVVDQLLVMGKKVWKVAEAGRPVVNTEYTPSVSVLPKSDDPKVAFYAMENWSAPETKSYRVTYRNWWNAKVIVFEFGIVYQYGGQYEGKGKYLTGVDVVPISLHVSYGFSFDATSAIGEVTNRGTIKDPIAAAHLSLNYKVNTLIGSEEKSIGFFVDGSGYYKKSY